MTAPDGRIPRPRAWHDEPSRRPASRVPVEDAWFSYNAAGDEIVWSEGLGAMLGRHARPRTRPSRQVLARYVHRDDQATRARRDHPGVDHP